MSNTFQIQSNNISSKQLPHNMEAEQGLLGAILINNEIFYDITEIVNSEHFHEPVHRIIFEVMNKMVSKGQKQLNNSPPPNSGLGKPGFRDN